MLKNACKSYALCQSVAFLKLVSAGGLKRLNLYLKRASPFHKQGVGERLGEHLREHVCGLRYISFVSDLPLHTKPFFVWTWSFLNYFWLLLVYDCWTDLFQDLYSLDNICELWITEFAGLPYHNAFRITIRQTKSYMPEKLVWGISYRHVREYMTGICFAGFN